jgi:cytochrome subunit of sulfide dehydrogenase
MNRKAIAAALACAALPVYAQETPAARSLAATCAACHGTDGRSVAQELVSLAGQPREHIRSQMRAFRDGTRPGTVMQQIAKGYSDQQIDLVADYFSRRSR